jgi:hypothetical protein
MTLFGPPNIEKLEARRDVKGLIKALGYLQDPKIRWCAATALSKVGDARAIAPLLDALKDRNWRVSQHAEEALKKILVKVDWQPGQDEIGAIYWIFKHELVKCIEIGTPAVDPLVHFILHGEKKFVRQMCAKALVTLYQGQKLDHRSNQKILNLRHSILQPHSDGNDGCGGHTDNGTGIDFPL